MVLPFGRSVYLSHPELIHALPPDPGAPIFLSLHIGEEFTADYPDRAKAACRELAGKGYRIIADVSVKTMAFFGVSDLADLASELQIYALRVDYGLSTEQICALAARMPIAINASTVSEAEAAVYAQSGKEIFAIHNFYPRPETGLDEAQFRVRTRRLQALGYRVYAFIPGDEALRGPVFAGLPTLESQRGVSPAAAYIRLCEENACDGVIVGDPGLSPQEESRIRRYRQSGIIPLVCRLDDEFSHLLHRTYSIREDSPAALIRVKESRVYSCKGQDVPPKNCVFRGIGAITMDNCRYGRYTGEVMILRKDFPPDDRVNVIGTVAKDYIPLLELITENRQFALE